jgi:hypothetical protein
MVDPVYKFIPMTHNELFLGNTIKPVYGLITISARSDVLHVHLLLGSSFVKAHSLEQILTQ